MASTVEVIVRAATSTQVLSSPMRCRASVASENNTRRRATDSAVCWNRALTVRFSAWATVKKASASSRGSR